MAKTSYIDILPELESEYFKGLTPGDRFTFARVRRKNTLLSKKRKKGISQRSLLPEISVIWATLTQEQKDAWGTAGALSNMNGWRLFIQDYCARRVNDLPDIATPSNLHQSWVGQLQISAPAINAKLIQIHPHFYYVKRKVTGTKSMYNPVLVNEDISLPFKLGFNYKSDLTSTGPGSFAKFYAHFSYSYQGQNLSHDLEIPLDYITDWKSVDTTLNSLESIVVRYDMYIEIYNMQGDLYFDNVVAEHSGQNWARDPVCKDINQGFTRNYYQIPKHWSAISAPEGVIFETIYKDF